MKKILLCTGIIALVVFILMKRDVSQSTYIAPSIPTPATATTSQVSIATSTGEESAKKALLPAKIIAPFLSLSSKSILQGDPEMIIVKNIGTTTISSASVTRPDDTTATLHFTPYANELVAFYGSSLSEKVGTATVHVILKNSTSFTSSFTIATRTQPTESLPVPEQLGGNSTSSQQTLVSNLEKENAELATVYSNPTTSYWTSIFVFPVKAPIIVTDPYGYNRDSGAETIVHKGTDFKAPPGTPVYAINNGIVRIEKLYTVYGNTVIIDHGVGILSFYMHLTSIGVAVGDTVKKGQLIGYSGETGYAEGPHLHLTIRVGGQSIDPIQFYALFGVKP